MAKRKIVVARNAVELATALNLSPADAVEMEIRRRLTDKLTLAVSRSGLTHVQVSKIAGVSRSRLTAILIRNTAHVSTGLMLRILASLGYSAKITFTKSSRAA
jgi:predicted XRE-type DNA-binding protein